MSNVSERDRSADEATGIKGFTEGVSMTNAMVDAGALALVSYLFLESHAQAKAAAKLVYAAMSNAAPNTPTR